MLGKCAPWLAVGLVVLVGAACGKHKRAPHAGDDDDNDTSPTATSSSTSDAAVPPMCAEGSRDTCKKDLVSGGVYGCFEGEKACIDGAWSDCKTTEEVNQLLVDAGLASPGDFEAAAGAGGAGGRGGGSSAGTPAAGTGSR